MTSYFNASHETSPYKEIDHKIFIGDEDYSDELCSVILFLSLVYNDLKFIQININMLNEALDLSKEKKILGEISSFYLYIHRLNIGLIYALQEKIKENVKVFDLFLFNLILRKLNKINLKSWTNLYNSSISAKHNASNPFYMIRNKTIFHYDLKEIQAGYKRKFSNGAQKPCISFGETIGKNTFLFC